ncbi:MAG: 16S rRNA (guanine(966)-N(2))-methyltransferase RsmD [Clostridia bacterium]|jgi:16S rRNA (guanine966-N2)-methyltransferase|nr:16S rRNA (guanine(966)-N(2))-methyltransferase RsmD [Clostridia bacterium]
MRIISGTARGTKLFTLDGLNTRPTLDRVKEPLFNILNFKLQDSVVLDLFAGSGALGLEAISRGAEKAIFSENNRDAQKIIEKNIDKTKFNDKAVLIKNDYKKALTFISENNMKCDVVFIDPPYKTELVKNALLGILEKEILNEDAIIILETDEPERIEMQISDLKFEIVDNRKYGRVSLIFLKQN